MDVERLAKHLLLKVVEPRTKRRFRIRPGQVAAITKELRRVGHDQTATFRTAKSRDDFLYAALRYLAPLEHEELIVALGTRRGTARSAGAALRQVHRVVGQRDRVSVTPRVQALISTAAAVPGGEVILVHNHPRRVEKTLIRHVVGWTPLPSDEDRRLAATLLTRRLAALLTRERPASLKWYLVDEDEIGEWTLPPFDDFERFVQQLAGVLLRR